MTEWNASGYQTISSLQEAIATEQLSRLTLQGNEHILDIGCGNGKITAAIAGCGSLVVYRNSTGCNRVICQW